MRSLQMSNRYFRTFLKYSSPLELLTYLKFSRMWCWYLANLVWSRYFRPMHVLNYYFSCICNNWRPHHWHHKRLICPQCLSSPLIRPINYFQLRTSLVPEESSPVSSNFLIVLSSFITVLVPFVLVCLSMFTESRILKEFHAAMILTSLRTKGEKTKAF